MNPITTISLSKIKLHPLLEHTAKLSENSPEFLSLCDDVIANGVLVPILITKDGLIVDGRHRFLAAKRAQLTELPGQEVPETEAANIILRTLIHRRHYTKGQLAYVGYPLFRTAHAEILNRRTDTLKGIFAGDKSVLPKTVEQLAFELGVSLDTFQQASKVHQIFQDDPSYKNKMEPKILATDSPMGLGAAIAGYAGRQTTRGVEKINPRHYELFATAITNQRKRFAYWEEFQEMEKVAAAKEIRLAVSEMPEELRNIWANALKTYTQSATKTIRG